MAKNTEAVSKIELEEDLSVHIILSSRISLRSATGFDRLLEFEHLEVIEFQADVCAGGI